jgi:xanthine dehydrogenase accessory factor
MDAAVLAEAAALIDARRAFALATVVWRRAPSSGHVGSKAIVLSDGAVHGWLGGACAEPTVIRQALDALEDGRPRLLFLGPREEFGDQERQGTIIIPMACESEGALEVYVEPVLPKPQLVVIGRSPAVHALAVQGRAVDWDVAVIDDGGQPSHHPVPEIVRTALDLAGLGIGPSTAIVVATQGHYDDLALRAALATDAGYIGLVAAEKRASMLLRQLHDHGVDDLQLARVHAPAGLDLGAVTNEEIAVAVLADLVRRRAAGEFRGHTVDDRHVEAIDPVCGMTVFVDGAKHHTVHDAREYWFCSAGCLHRFQTEPHTYVR